MFADEWKEFRVDRPVVHMKWEADSYNVCQRNREPPVLSRRLSSTLLLVSRVSDLLINVLDWQMFPVRLALNDCVTTRMSALGFAWPSSAL
jgi:hypothetical protein